jgi:hypothetical protein
MKATARKTEHPINRHQWLAHVKAQKKSGLNRTEYCKQYNLSYHAMTYWTGKGRTTPAIKTTLVPVPLRRDILQSSSRTEQVALRIKLTEKISIEVGENFSTTTLTRLLDTLEAR